MFQNLNDIGIHYYKHGVVASKSPPLPDNQEKKQEQELGQDVVDVYEFDDKIKLD